MNYTFCINREFKLRRTEVRVTCYSGGLKSVLRVKKRFNPFHYKTQCCSIQLRVHRQR